MIVNKYGSISEISENIFVVKAFIPNDQIELLINFIDSHQGIARMGQEGKRRSIPLGVVPFASSAWNIENLRKIKLSNFPVEVQQTFNFILEKTIQLVKELYQDSDDMHCSNAIFAKQLPGGKVGIHKDTEPGIDEHIIYSAVLYLNTIQDGDIEFPNLGVSHRPNSGDLLLYRSDQQNSEHGVTSISEDRYSVPIFISKDKNCYIE
jgi:hypothetical protein